VVVPDVGRCEEEVCLEGQVETADDEADPGPGDEKFVWHDECENVDDRNEDDFCAPKAIMERYGELSFAAHEK